MTLFSERASHANTRLIPLEGVENFRDYGGYPSRYGGSVVWGYLFRAAHQAAATDDDLRVLAEMNLGHVVDLRRPSERAMHPSRRYQGFVAEVIECDQGDQAEAPHVAFLRDTDLTPASVRKFFDAYYAGAPFEPRHIDLYSRYFRALAEGDGAVLIHCTAGKDRTGILAALTHHLLGVHPDDMFADFLLTNAAVRMEARAPMVAQALEASLGKTPSDVAVRAFLGVEAAYLDRAFQVMTERTGSPEAYLAMLGVNEKDATAIRLRLLD